MNGQGGPVLALRRPNGKAYWAGTEVAVQSTASDLTDNSADDQILEGITNEIPFLPRIVQINDGLVNIDLGPVWYQPYNDVFQVGNYSRVISGPYPFVLGPIF